MQRPDDTSFVVGPPHDPQRYTVGAPHNVGGEGVVYRGFDQRTPGTEEVAIKALYPCSTADVDWHLQVEVMRTINHAGVVAVRDGFVGPPIHQVGLLPAEGEVTYVVMAWVEGETLHRFITRAHSVDRVAVLTALSPVVEAIDLINSGDATDGIELVHRDVKPENIIINPEGSAVLVDFGLTGPLESQPPGVGTPGYRAWPPAPDAGHRPDVYAMAGVVSFVLTGHEPPDAPDELGAVLQQAGVGREVEGMVLAARRSGGRDVHALAPWLTELISALDHDLVVDNRSGFGDDGQREDNAPAVAAGQPAAARSLVGPSAEGASARAAKARRLRLLRPALALGGMVLLAVAAWELSARPGASNATAAPCSASLAAQWQALELPEATTSGVSWLDADGDCTHDLYEVATGSPGPVDVETQHEAVLAALLSATSVLGLDYASCDPSDWNQAALGFVSASGLNLTWVDRDADCLHDAYELNAVGLRPDRWDTDGDGVGDSLDIGRAAGVFAHAPDRQLHYLWDLYVLDSEFAVPDPTACRADAWAAAALQWMADQRLDDGWEDPDGDCLDTDYERDVAGTLPTDADTDGDGIGDGTDPDTSNGTIEAIDVQLNPLGVGRLDRPGPPDGETFKQPRADGPD